MVITEGDGKKHEVTFDSKTAQQGWNLVGQFLSQKEILPWPSQIKQTEFLLRQMLSVGHPPNKN